MSDHTGIEWTDATWNPVTGCTEVSAGCDHCYARTFAERWRDVPGHHFERGFDVTLRPDKLGLPLRWRRPRRVFVNSMSDLFHAAVPSEFIAAVWVRMLWTSPHLDTGRPVHTYQLLTKRPGRMRSWLQGWADPGQRTEWIAQAVDRGWCHPRDEAAAQGWPTVLSNVWLGVSVEDQRWAGIRIPILLQTPAAVRFLSCEPLLGPLDLSRWLGLEWFDSFGWDQNLCAALAEQVGPGGGLHWVIAGGESGHGARPLHPDWVRGLRDQCLAAQTPFLFKQWGMYRPGGDPARPAVWVDSAGTPGLYNGTGQVAMVRVGKHAAGRVLDGRTWDEFPGRRV
jgi:protein gp37